ncbi:FAD-binding oxidoreductase [Paralimibaculum aggregatum]|uniref:FAD-binding oxidoreductase n=1 Tax=Paralimibaculum aggregatum TaxID=3036245 RepID=A0ABQ6LR63_9RHOB|nr:FAD-binding oxidoreductase [Limibaculum sp. NKW23]GMG84358.1 FAD-binding oxidoreductase [Limibaculum sp. NKW23]
MDMDSARDLAPPPAAGRCPPLASAELAGWGRVPRRRGALAAPRDAAELAALLRAGRPAIARGAGRAYGDAALAAEGGLALSMHRFDRLLGFDPASGTLTAEAGVVLGDLIRAMLPRGWFPAVTPGTQYATLGGLIAADVHGKNHHVAGSFGAHLGWIDLMGADGEIRRVSPETDPALFAATCGGMGLTGVILRAALRLQPVESGWIREETVAAGSLDAGMAAFDAAEARADAPPYSVAWIDTLARGPERGRMLLHLGAHATAAELEGRDPYATPPRRSLTVPMDAPSWLLNGLTMGAFNALYWAAGQRRAAAGPRLTDWERYFYPLDALHGWNRLYGRRGFLQVQSVLPAAPARDALAEMLDASAAAGLGFLGVLKRFGPQASPFSFPRAGWTLALDIPAGWRGHELADRLEAIAAAAGGRFYLAKDARLTRSRFEATEPRAAAFRALRQERGLAGRFASAQSERLGL